MLVRSRLSTTSTGHYTCYLTANTKTVAENLADLGFVPSLVQSVLQTVDKAVVRFCHEKGIKVIPMDG
jgi:hypothetical protein